jgi:Rapamycin-insensitive companion of mTOR, N-term
MYVFGSLYHNSKPNSTFPKALLSMCEESTTGTNLSRKATLLMAELLHIANKVLPLSVAANLQVIVHKMAFICSKADPSKPQVYSSGF